MCKPTNILKILNYCNKNAKFLQYLVKISQFLSSLSSLKSFVCTMRTKKPFICLNYIILITLKSFFEQFSVAIVT